MRNLISPTLTDNLIRLALAYQKATEETNPHMSLRRVSRMAHGDPPFFDKLIAGECSVTLRKYDEVIAWFDDHAAWPAGFARPKLNDPRHGKRRVNENVPAPKPKKPKAKTDGKKGRDGSKRKAKAPVAVGSGG